MQIVWGIVLVAMLFFMWPALKAALARSQQAEQKHWGSFVLIVLALAGFIYLLILSLQ